MELRVDPKRDFNGGDQNETGDANATGIYVRAKRDGKWDSVDIAELDRESLDYLLKEHGLIWTSGVVAILLNHPQRS